MAHPSPQAANKAVKQDETQEDKSPGPLSNDIHPPPTILNIDLVRILERNLSRDAPKAAAAAGEPQEQEFLPGGVPNIGPSKTMHLQMTPMVRLAAIQMRLLLVLKDAHRVASTREAHCMFCHGSITGTLNSGSPGVACQESCHELFRYDVSVCLWHEYALRHSGI
jgi:hypothetical protein